MERVLITAPAKINLYLDVTGKRSDGYHEVVNIMQSISLSDTISIEKSNLEKISIKCNVEDVPKSRKNTAYRAAEIFLEKAGMIFQGLNISIHKEIPVQAGLGGGSADAAAVLCGLNRLFEKNYSLEELCRMGASIGADVPFCIVGGTQLCRGIGDVMSAAPPLEDCFIVFEKVSATASVSEIKELLDSCGAGYSAMTGSGSAVFGLFTDKPTAELTSRAIRDKGYFSTVCFPASEGAYNYVM